LAAIAGALAFHLPASFSRFLRHFNELFVTLVLATVMAYVIKPLVDFLSNRPFFAGGKWVLPRWVSSLFALLALLTGLVFLGWLMVRPVTQEALRLANALPDLVRGAAETYAAKVPSGYRQMIEAQAAEWADTVLSRLSRGATATVGWLRYLVELFLIPVLAFYFVSDAPALRREFFTFVPGRLHQVGVRLLNDFGKVMDGYIRGQILLCLIAGVVVTVALYAIRSDFALTFGAFAGVSRAIPIIGPVVGSVPIVVVILARMGANAAGVMLIFLTILHAVESKVIMPRLLGERVNLHPVAVIVALLLGKAFMGILGMLIATPVAAVVKVVVTHWKEYSRSLRVSQ